MSDFSKEIFEAIVDDQLKTHYLAGIFFDNPNAILTTIINNDFSKEIITKALSYTKNGYTLLHLAVKSNNEQLVDYLFLRSTLNPFLKDTSQKSAYQYSTNPKIKGIFAVNNALIGVGNVSLQPTCLVNKIAIGAEISIVGKNKPDVIKGKKSYMRITGNDTAYRELINLRFNQYMEANKDSSDPLILSCLAVISGIVSTTTPSRNMPSSNHKLTHEQKKAKLASRKADFETMKTTFETLYKEIDDNEKFTVPKNLRELQVYQDNLIEPVKGCALVGTVIGCAPLAAGSLVFGPCAGASVAQIPPCITVTTIGCGYWALAWLPLTWIPTLLCTIPWAVNNCREGNATYRIDKIEDKKSKAESQVCELFKEYTTEKFKDLEISVLIQGDLTRQKVSNCLNRISTLLNNEMNTFNRTLKQSKLISFFSRPTPLKLTIVNPVIPMKNSERIHEQSSLRRNQ